MISRAIKCFPDWKTKFETLGFRDITFTDQEKDSLNFIIRDMKPNLVLITSEFYSRSTPYMMRILVKEFPKLNIAVFNRNETYPDDLGIYCIANGVKSYVNEMDGMEEYNRGLKLILDGKKYVSPAVEERRKTRTEDPEPARIMTEKLKTVIRLTCYGFKDEEIAENMQISRRTVNSHKKIIYRSLNIRTVAELIGVSNYLGFTNPYDNCVFPKGFTLNPNKIEKTRKPGVSAGFSGRSICRAKTPSKAKKAAASMPSA